MDFLEKVTYLMKRDKLNKHTLSQQSGIPYTTIDGWFKKGYESAKVSTLIKLADFFDVELDYLVRPSISDSNYGKTRDLLSSNEGKLIVFYRSMNQGGQELMLNTVRAFAGNPELRRNPNEEASAMYDHVNRLIKDALPDGKASLFG